MEETQRRGGCSSSDEGDSSGKNSGPLTNAFAYDEAVHEIGTPFNQSGGEQRFYFANKDESTAGGHFVFEIMHILKCSKLVRDNG